MTTNHSLCLHDPLWERDLEGLDSLRSTKTLGIACTGLALLAPDWVNKHSARKVILHRSPEQVNRSLDRLGLQQFDEGVWDYALWNVKGLHVYWDDMFQLSKADFIYQHLLNETMDVERHRELVKMNVQPQFNNISVNGRAARDLVGRYANAINEARANPNALGRRIRPLR